MAKNEQENQDHDIDDDNLDPNELDPTDQNQDLEDENNGEVETEKENKNEKLNQFLKKFGAIAIMGIGGLGYLGFKMLSAPEAPVQRVVQSKDSMQQSEVAAPEASEPAENNVTVNSMQQPVSTDASASNPAVPSEVNVGLPKDSEPKAMALSEVGDLKEMVSKIEQNGVSVSTRLDSIEARLLALEQRGGEGVKSNKKLADSSSKDATVKQKTKPKKKEAKELKADEKIVGDHLFDTSIEVKQEISSKKIEPAPLKLRGVIKDRFWISTEHGDESFTISSTLPNGAKVKEINAYRGEVVTTMGILKMPREIKE